MRKAYEEYKATGIQWLPKIPRHWDYKKINSLFLERKTKVSDKDYQPLSVTKSGILHQLTDAAKSSDSDNRKLVMSGDFVINSRSDRKGSCGVSALDGSVSLINIVLEPKRKLEQLFVHYLLRCQPFSEEYYRYGRGIVADLWTTRYSEMKSIFLPVPPREEQEQIVRFLDWKVSSINKLINVKQQEISDLKELKKATISDAVTHGLDKTVPMKDSGISWLGNIPKHWEIIVSKRLIQIANGCEPRTEGLIPVYGSGGMFKTCGEFRLPPAVLLGRKGTIDRPQYITEPYWNVDTAFSVTIKRRDLMTLKYYYFCSILFNYGYYMTQTALPSMTQKDYELIKIPLPPINEQRNIVNTIELRCAEIDRLIAAKQAQITNLHDLKSSLIADVVTGQIDVRDVAIPNYETVQEHADEAPDTIANPLEEAEEV
ncbi:restriction endonuclease subunit S [Fannyhessea vaginae]|uniref:restriction endonuclease subunit S n=1 Tax=Fannyhessea vaginae TaxID=82135 RepID=UPI00336A7749